VLAEVLGRRRALQGEDVDQRVELGHRHQRGAEDHQRRAHRLIEHLMGRKRGRKGEEVDTKATIWHHKQHGEKQNS
jgi:hypothetical protein